MKIVKISRLGRGLVVVALLMLCVVASLPAGATDQVSTLRHRRQQVAARHRHLQREIRQAGRAQRGLLARIGRLDASRARIHAEVRSLRAATRRLDRRIAATRRRLTAAVRRLRAITNELQTILRRLDRRTQDFTTRAIASYEAGPGADLEALLSSQSFGDLLDRYTYYQSTMVANARLVDEIKSLGAATASHRSAVVQQRNDIRATKRELEHQRAALARRQRREHGALVSLRRVISDKHAAVSQIEHRKAQLQTAIAENERESAQIQALLQAAETGAGPATGSGQLVWPVVGPITSGFGWRVHPIFHTREFHPGIDIGAAYGTPVHAADEGVIEYAGTMSGYGNVLVIDHGGGLATLYGHLSAFSVSAGQRVARGAYVARVGCTGWCTGAHLHFEVRVSGRPVNPLPYLNRAR